MNQVKIGKFIAETRRGLNLTQRQLADRLSVSDKTVSKWECGKGLPEVSLMLPLCDALSITVNDLLSGERVAAADYRASAEQNMIHLLRERRENRTFLAVSAICGALSVIAGGALVALAAFADLPAAARIVLIVFAVAVAAVGIGGAAVLDRRAGHFECPHCKNLFVPTMKEYVRGAHTFTKRRLRCPACGKTGMCRHTLK